MSSKIFFKLASGAALAHIFLTVLAMTEGEGTPLVLSSAVLATTFSGLAVVIGLRRHREQDAEKDQRKFPPRGM